MEYRSTDIRTGLFIAFSIAAFVVLVFLMGGVRGAFRDARELEVLFDDVRLLEVEASATVGGFRVGEVASISRLDPPVTIQGERYQVRVVLRVDRDLDLRTDASALVRTDGFLGAKFVALAPGVAKEPLPPDRAIHGRLEIDMAGIMARLEEPIARLNSILAVFNSVVDRPENIRNVEGIVSETHELLRRVRTDTVPKAEALVTSTDRTVREIEEKIATVGEQLCSSVERTVLAVRKLAESAEARVQKVDPILHDLSATLATLRQRLDRVFDRTDQLLLDNNRNIYLTIRNVRDATAELDRLIRKLRADPSVVIWGDDEKTGPRTPPRDLDILREEGRARRYGKEPGK